MKRCVFCGKPPEEKNKEHVIPRWLIEATGDPKRSATFGTHNLNSGKPKTFAFDQFTFPACKECNEAFSRLESRAKTVVTNLVNQKPLSETDFSTLLDWLDKVRIGIWLGLMQLERNPWGIEPKFHIAQRIALHDRSVGIARVPERSPGINLIGPESPCFGHSPTTMGILINQIALFNDSSIGLCSRRLGFPFPSDCSLRDDGLMECSLTEGLQRILKPVERVGDLQALPFLYQPILERGVLESHDLVRLYDTVYVRTNCLDFNAGLGSIFFQHRQAVEPYGADPSLNWLPRQTYSLREVYRAGRRWAYKKLERHYGETAQWNNLFLPVWRKVHEKLIPFYESEMGLRG